MLTPWPHLDLTVLDETPAELNQALIEILVWYHEALAWSEGFDGQASVPKLSQHFLHWPNLVNDVEVVFLVNDLLKSACKLLYRVDKNLKTLSIHLKSFGERSSLTLNQCFCFQNHVVLYLSLVDIHLALGLIVGLNNRWSIDLRLGHFCNCALNVFDWIVD